VNALDNGLGACHSANQQEAERFPFPLLCDSMPRKVRQLMRDLEQAGFVNRGGKGDHRNYEHPLGIRVTLSGNTGDDAKPYQEREVRRALREAQQ
jgi:predicted RNA binding protein YcfA (HicA-like mRNA interferase family)